MNFIVTVKTMFTIMHLPVTATSSAEALIKMADRIPLCGAKVTVVAV